MISQMEAALAVFSNSTMAFTPNEEEDEVQDRVNHEGVTTARRLSSKTRYPSIRLSRSASARTMAVIEHNRMRAAREAEGIFSSSLEATDDAPGPKHTSSPGKRQKLGNAAALDLIRRIYIETKQEFDPIGKADSDKLSSLQIGGASTVLQTLTWREFFEGKTIKAKKREMAAEAEREAHRAQTRLEEIKASRLVNKMHYLAPTEGTIDPPSPTLSPSSSPLSPTKRRIEEIRLQRTADTAAQLQMQLQAPPANPNRSPTRLDAFHGLCRRIEALWLELQMSPADQSFFRKSLLAAPPSGGGCSEQHLVELARYLRLLQDHKHATVKALKASQARDTSLAQLRHVLEKIDVFEGRVAARGQALREVSAVDLFGTPFGLDAAEVTAYHTPLPPALRAELCFSVKDVQIRTLNLIRRVQKWRCNLWRPRAFMVAGPHGVEVDCFLEMQRDARELLAGGGSSSSGGGSGDKQHLGYFTHLSDLPLFPWDLGCIVFSPDIDASEAEIAGATSSPDWARLDVSLREAFLEDGPRRSELIAANRLVLGHAALQRSLQQEQQALLAKRAFIPMLKVPPASASCTDIIAGLWDADGAPIDSVGSITATQVFAYAGAPSEEDRGRAARQLVRGGMLEEDHGRRVDTLTEEVHGHTHTYIHPHPHHHSHTPASSPDALSPAHRPKPRSASPTNQKRGIGKKATLTKTKKPVLQPMPRPPDVGNKRKCCHEADHAARKLAENQAMEREELQSKLALIRRPTTSASPSRSPSWSQGRSGSPGTKRNLADTDEPESKCNHDLKARIKAFEAELSGLGRAYICIEHV